MYDREMAGIKPKEKVKIEWSSDFAYAIGLLVTDGSLSKDGRHISFTSKDRQLIKVFLKSLKIDCHIGKKASGSQREKKYFVVQIGDVIFYRFLVSIGLMPNKTKIIGEVQVPHKYFMDFLRGHLDGDGTFYSYWDPRWKSSYMFYTAFVSASTEHILWLQRALNEKMGIRGHISRAKGKSWSQLKYAKRESLKLLKYIYYSSSVACLERKRLKINKALHTIGIVIKN